TKNILDNNRWDSHYHNPKYINTRRKVDAENAKYLKNLVTEVTESVDKLHEDKVGYIEISNVNNRTGRINGIKFDYINKLPKNGKIILKDEDILISKVRPYRGSIAIYKEYSAELCTASKSAFVVIRAEEFMYPYYLTAFLRYRLGLDQIVMNQSGTTYPTVKPEEIMNVKVILLEDMKMKEINEIYRKNIDSKYHEEKNIQSIIELLESSFS
ncbi:TPA: restriction endonuclease subunit S, partial [Staphylococcus aureus]|nr:restriction endonuclease subunit S [Staphylococcus aureus]HCW8857215.1 restriction endonuclease subunit S [Staphylococcus aureus]HDI7400776.1 restriction endonuclease subunit S [Staphylococcus aureus]HEK5803624.1 restriction endonuclease subunit S [Staphylococcus aureus]